MAMVTFDTLKFVRTLEASGLASKQAEAISFAVRDAQETVEVATKADLREVELRIDARLGRMQGDIDARFQRMQGDIDARFERVEGDMRLFKWMLGVVVAGIVALVMKAFLHG